MYRLLRFGFSTLNRRGGESKFHVSERYRKYGLYSFAILRIIYESRYLKIRECIELLFVISER